MKKIIYLVLALSLICSSAYANDIKINNVDGYYTISGNDKIKDSSNSNPSQFTGEKDSVKYAAIMTGVRGVGSNAFKYCTSLRDVVIPSSVTYIGSQAFAGCSWLSSVVIPYGVTRIDNYAFIDCKNLKSVYIPDSVTIIGESAFYGCDNLTIYSGESACVDAYVKTDKINVVKFSGDQNQIIDVLSDVKIMINGTELEQKYPVIMKNQMTLIPLRTIFEAVGCEVSWDDAAKTANASKDGVTLGFKTNSDEVIAQGGVEKLATPTALICDNTMVHIRAVEKFGMNVEWNGETKTISITY